MKHHRTCSRCKSLIKKTHRWHVTHHEIKVFGIVLFRWDTVSHRDCMHPETAPYAVKRIRGERPLHFPEEPLLMELKTTGVHEAKHPFTFDSELNNAMTPLERK